MREYVWHVGDTDPPRDWVTVDVTELGTLGQARTFPTTRRRTGTVATRNDIWGRTEEW